MARPKKDTVHKEEIVKEETVSKEVKEDIQEKEEVVVESKKTSNKKKFSDHDYVLCRSVTVGGLGIIGAKTDSYYRFPQYGAECDIEYVDLVQLVRSRSSYVFLPRIIIEDDDFLEEFPQVVEAYNNMYSNGDLRKILQLPADKMRIEIEKLPRGSKETIKTMAATMIANGGIDSIASSRVLSDIFGADFNLLSDLFADK